MRLLRITLCVLLLQLGLAGCDSGSGSSEPEVPKTEFACELGLIDADSKAFVAVTPGMRAELILGFQGFLFVEFLVRADEELLPASSTASFKVVIEGTLPTGATQPQVTVERVEQQKAITVPILLFLDGGDPSEFAGKEAEVTIRLEGPTTYCLVESKLLLVDDDPCVHTGEEPICPGDPGATQ